MRIKAKIHLLKIKIKRWYYRNSPPLEKDVRRNITRRILEEGEPKIWKDWNNEMVE